MTNKNEMPDVIYARMALIQPPDHYEPDAYLDEYPDADVNLTKYVRADIVQQPVIEGLDEAIIHCASDTTWPNRYCELLLRAARLYAQGQTAQPQGDLVLCRRVIKEPEHEGATGYEYFVPVKEAQPVDLDGFNKLVEMLEREPQHNPRLSALLREDSVFDKQPTEDAQRALQLFNDYFSTDPAVKNDEELQGMVKTIRSALAQMKGD